MDEKKGSRRTRLCLRLLVAFLVVMAIFTVASRAAASFTTTQVSVECPAERRIEHQIMGAGTVEANQEMAVLTEPGILVKTVYARVGDRMEEGGLIAELEPQSLDRRIAELEEGAERERLEDLKESGGKVMSPVAGTITKMFLEVGQKTTDTAAATIADDASGLRYVGSISGEDAAWLSEGDTVSLTAGGKRYADLPISSIDSQEGEVRVTVFLDAGTFSIGESASMVASKQSQSYPLTLPTSALHIDQGRHFVYVLEEVETVLGTELATQRVDVELLEQSQLYAAVESPILGMDAQVVTDSDSYVSAGDRVRLREP